MGIQVSHIYKLLNNIKFTNIQHFKVAFKASTIVLVMYTIVLGNYGKLWSQSQVPESTDILCRRFISFFDVDCCI